MCPVMVDCDNKIFITGADRNKFEYYDITKNGELLSIEALMVTRSSMMTIVLTTDFRVLTKRNNIFYNDSKFEEIPDLRAKYVYTYYDIIMAINMEDELLSWSAPGLDIKIPPALPGFKVMSASCGLYHFVIVTTDYQVFGKGYSDYGQLGLNPKIGVRSYHPNFELIPNVLATDVGCGNHFTAIITPEHHLMMTGSNNSGTGNGPMPTFTKIFDGYATFLLCGPDYIIIGDIDNKMYTCGKKRIGRIPNKFVTHLTEIPNFLGISAFKDDPSEELYLVSEDGQVFKCSVDPNEDLKLVPDIICSNIPTNRFRNAKPAR